MLTQYTLLYVHVRAGICPIEPIAPVFAPNWSPVCPPWPDPVPTNLLSVCLQEICNSLNISCYIPEPVKPITYCSSQRAPPNELSSKLCKCYLCLKIICKLRPKLILHSSEGCTYLHIYKSSHTN